MITGDAQSRSARHTPDISALREIVRRSEMSGARRRVAVLFMDRLPKALAKPHHMRLVRLALQSLFSADRAQVFDIPPGRMVVVWRGDNGSELDVARQSLDHLLSGHPGTSCQGSGDLLLGYDLPQQAERLLDDLADQARRGECDNLLGLDSKLLADLETTLACADLARFALVRPVVALEKASGLDTAATPAWEERYFAIEDLAAGLAPGRDFKAACWLFRRLTRILDMRMLALLAAPGELARCGPFAIYLNVATILSPAFLRFDKLLPGHLRGEVLLILRAADILADGAEFALARNFARSRLYRLGLADVSAPLLGLLDVAAAGIDLLRIPMTQALRETDFTWRDLVAPGSGLLLTDITRPSELRWAIGQGFRLGCGALFSR